MESRRRGCKWASSILHPRLVRPHLPHAVHPHLSVLIRGGLVLEVWPDAVAVNVCPVGRQVLPDGDGHAAAVRKLVDALNEALAVGLPACEGSPRGFRGGAEAQKDWVEASTKSLEGEKEEEEEEEEVAVEVEEEHA
jgi:hypothetical protein